MGRTPILYLHVFRTKSYDGHIHGLDTTWQIPMMPCPREAPVLDKKGNIGQSTKPSQKLQLPAQLYAADIFVDADKPIIFLGPQFLSQEPVEAATPQPFGGYTVQEQKLHTSTIEMTIPEVLNRKTFARMLLSLSCREGKAELLAKSQLFVNLSTLSDLWPRRQPKVVHRKCLQFPGF